MPSSSPKPQDEALQPFSLAARELAPGRVAIEVSGELDLAVASQVQAAITDASEGNGIVVVQLAACGFIDSTAIAILIHARQALAARGGRLLLVEPVGQVRHVLEVSGLLEPDFVFDSVDAALADLGQRSSSTS